MEDDVFPDGRVVKKGTKVLYSMYSMGRMESIWGEDCREYKPDRWLRDGRFTPEPAYKFPAFNAGPRTCLGKDFAYFQMKFVASAVLLRYSVRIPADRLSAAPKLALTLYMKHGLQVQLIPRQ